MKKMTLNEIRESWINFFKAKKHHFLEPVSLIPYNDNSLLWINSGVATLKDYFSGKKNPPAPRLVNSQKALRTNDFFNVGLTSRHQTLFEMLGNFSIGDYFKDEAIEFAYELLTKEWAIDVNKLWFTVFKDDEVAFKKWISLGIDPKRVLKCDRDRNFWDVGNGPCGPCTEIYYDRGLDYDFDRIGEKLIIDDIENDRYIEIWNIVFSEFNNDGNNHYEELSRKNIDTGAGLERLASISQNVPTNFDIDIFQDIIKSVQKYTDLKYDINNYFLQNEKQTKINFAYRVIADHFRAAVFAIADGAIPSNKDRGYIVRRLIRRAMVFAHQLRIDHENYLQDLIHAIIVAMGDFYHYLHAQEKKVLEVVQKESNLFKKTLAQGLKFFEESIKNDKLDNNVTFDLVVTYGFPIELIKEIANEKKIKIDLDVFETKFKEHQLISRANNQTKAMDQQNSELLNLEVASEFLYDKEVMDAQIIKIYDENFQELNHLIGDGYLVFNQTPFYATSGGQISDTGLINDLYEIDDVFKAPNFQHIHHVVGADLVLNQEVKLAINSFDRKRIAKNHSVEHLLHASLKKNVDENLKQEGAFKSPDKVTFDFQYHKKLDDEQLGQVEQWINDQIKLSHEVNVLNMSLEEAQQAGALAYFGEVYKKIHGKLRVIDMGKEVSLELCGGTHVHNTKDIEIFKILDYYSKGSGSWRIEATATQYNIDKYLDFLLEKINKEWNSFVEQFKKEMYDIDELNVIINNFQTQTKKIPIRKINELYLVTKQKINDLKKVFYLAKIEKQKLEIISFFKKINNPDKKALFLNESFNIEAIKNASNDLINQFQKTVFIIFTNNKNNWQYFGIANEEYMKQNQINLNEVLAKKIHETFGGKGGGKPSYIQGGFSIDIKKETITQFLLNAGFSFA